MEDKKIKLLIERLLEKTKEGKIHWESTSNPNIYLAVLSDSAVSIKYIIPSKVRHWLSAAIDDTQDSPLVRTNPNYEFDLRDENGDVVESFIITNSDQELFAKAEDIYELARSQALKDNPIVDSILEQLEAA